MTLVDSLVAQGRQQLQEMRARVEADDAAKRVKREQELLHEAQQKVFDVLGETAASTIEWEAPTWAGWGDKPAWIDGMLEGWKFRFAGTRYLGADVGYARPVLQLLKVCGTCKEWQPVQYEVSSLTELAQAVDEGQLAQHLCDSCLPKRCTGTFDEGGQISHDGFCPVHEPRPQITVVKEPTQFEQLVEKLDRLTEVALELLAAR